MTREDTVGDGIFNLAQPPALFRLCDLPKYTDQIAVRTVEDWRFKNSGGINTCLSRPGGRVFVNRDKFNEWLERGAA